MLQWRGRAGDGQGQEAGIGFGGAFVEGLTFVFEAAEDHCAASDEEEIAEDGAGERGFDDVVEAAGEGDKAEDQFSGISEGGVNKPSPGGAGALGKMFGGFAHERGEGNDAHARKEKGGDGFPLLTFAEPEVDGKGGGDGEEAQEVEVPHGVSTLENPTVIPSGMQHANHFYSAFDRFVEEEIISHGKAAKPPLQIVSHLT